MNKEKTLKYLYRLISNREYLEQTLRQKLHKKNVSYDIIEESINRLKELKYIDDESYVRSFVKSKIRKQEGPNRIRNKLFLLGANSDYVELMISELYTDELINENIKALILRKSKKVEDRDKIIAYCSRRGFSISKIISIEEEIRQNNGI